MNEHIFKKIYIYTHVYTHICTYMRISALDQFNCSQHTTNRSACMFFLKKNSSKVSNYDHFQFPNILVHRRLLRVLFLRSSLQNLKSTCSCQ